MDEATAKQYLADDPPSVVSLKIQPHFDNLSPAQKLYAHHISRACFAGSRITMRQVSPESEDIYDFIMELQNASKGDWKTLQKTADISDEALNQFLLYAAQFLGNMGNYKSFGDSKFVPRVDEQSLTALAMASPEADKLFLKIKDHLYTSKTIPPMHFGYPDEGHLSTYYPDSPDIMKEEITIISDFLGEKGLLPENTRLRKTVDGNFEVLIASEIEIAPSKGWDVTDREWYLAGTKLEGKRLSLVFGDHTKELTKIAQELKEAGEYASNDTQKRMHENYVESFRTGSLKAFKDSQRYWIKDKKPVVETDIGFIETYRDPHGIRGEWEGFVAMVNQERTRAFSKLVESAPAYIPLLPWGKEFEKDEFTSPDFTSLEVLTFCGSGIPAGINIPNYDDIRQTEGFKNVSLGNVLSAKDPKEVAPSFIRDEDLSVFKASRDSAFEVQVGLHELLGHGCGKLLQETEPGKYNFNINNPPVSPITNAPITTWYKPGQTWGSVFGSIASSYEECRAECVAMALSCDFSVLKIFGFGDGSEDIDGPAGDILYAAYLQMARAGICALEFYNPAKKLWGQIHMQARFAILQTFLSAGGDFCVLETEKPDLSDLKIKLDRAKILSHGRPAVEKLLQKLHVFKATADFESGKKLYEEVTRVDEFYAEKVRPEVLRQKQPRKVYVQANTVVKGNDVVLKEYDATPEGMIQSFADRNYI
ncbi:MAG: hypothetical protein M1820_000576 [Bogoriella megaspora]|nr:MAG: hypothetical protein M1820_000576 [Bogoriella megaspora]